MDVDDLSISEEPTRAVRHDNIKRGVQKNSSVLSTRNYLITEETSLKM